jgi:hypothetical protein
MLYNAKLMTGNLHKLTIPKVFTELWVLWEDIGGITDFLLLWQTWKLFLRPVNPQIEVVNVEFSEGFPYYFILEFK